MPPDQIQPENPVEFEALEDSKTVVSEGGESGERGEDSTTEPPSLIDLVVDSAALNIRPCAKSLLRPKAEVRRPRPVHPCDARVRVLAAKARPPLDARSGVLACKGKGSEGKGSSEGK